MNPAGHPLLGGFIGLIGAFAYGVNGPAARVAGLGGVNGSNLAMQRGFLLAAALLVFFLLTRRSFGIQKGQGRKIFAAGICAGLTGVCFLSSLSFVPVAIAVTLFYTFPLILIILTTVVDKTPPSRLQVLAFFIAFSGIVLCVGPTFDQLDWFGMALAFIAAIATAFLFRLTSAIQQDSVSLIFWIQVFALPMTLAVATATGFSPKSAIISVWQAILISAAGFYIGFACQVVAAAKVHAATLGLIFLIEPVVAIVSAATFLGEAMLPVQYAGIILVIGGLAINIWGLTRNPNRDLVTPALS